MINFQQKTIIITGSSMGIGKATALSLLHQKARVVINARGIDKLKATELEFQNLGFDVLAIAGDISQEVDCRRLIDKTIERFGSIDILINNAGVSMRGAIENLSAKVIMDVFNCNAIAPFMLTQMALPHILKNKGSVVYISSLVALRGLPYLSVYCSAKMALKGLAQSLRIEHATDGIHVGLVYVGITKIERGKMALAVDGTLIELKKRDGFFAMTTDSVAKKIIKNIRLRKNTSIIGVVGKVYYFATQYFEFIFPVLSRLSMHRLKKLYD